MGTTVFERTILHLMIIHGGVMALYFVYKGIRALRNPDPSGTSEWACFSGASLLLAVCAAARAFTSLPHDTRTPSFTLALFTAILVSLFAGFIFRLWIERKPFTPFAALLIGALAASSTAYAYTLWLDPPVLSFRLGVVADTKSTPSDGDTLWENHLRAQEKQRQALLVAAGTPRPTSEFPFEVYRQAFEGRMKQVKLPGTLLWFPDRVVIVTNPIEHASGDFSLSPDSTVTAYWGHPISEPKITAGWQVSNDGKTWTDVNLRQN